MPDLRHPPADTTADEIDFEEILHLSHDLQPWRPDTLTAEFFRTMTEPFCRSCADWHEVGADCSAVSDPLAAFPPLPSRAEEIARRVADDNGLWNYNQLTGAAFDLLAEVRDQARDDVLKYALCALVACADRDENAAHHLVLVFKDLVRAQVAA